MEDNGYGVFGTDLFIGGMPLEYKGAGYWIVGSGGRVLSKLKTTGKFKGYMIEVFYRNVNQETVIDTIYNLEEFFNDSSCIEIGDFDTVELEADVLPSDLDIDGEERAMAYLQVILTIYNNN